jgi:integrase
MLKEYEISESSVKKLAHNDEGHDIPPSDLKESIKKIKYASHDNVMFKMCGITGCRIRELNNMELDRIFGKIIYWNTAKNQCSVRKMELPESYIKELETYRRNNYVKGNKLFGISSDTFRRRFNKIIRPKLGERWNIKRPLFLKNGKCRIEYRLQLKGLRKTYQTKAFVKFYDKWGDANIAMEKVCKEMKHSSKHITSYHYVENLNNNMMNEYRRFQQQELFEKDNQKRIMDF